MISRLSSSDPALVALSFLWILAVIAVGEGTRRVAHLPPEVTRKVVHVGVALWALPTALLFDSPWWAAAAPLVFVLLNALSYRFRLMEVVEEGGRGSPGTIYFPLSFAALILILWPLGARAASVAGLYAMGLGDAAASVVGRRCGRHPYGIAGSRKSWEGTAAMFVFSFAGILLGTWPLLGQPAFLPSLGAAVAATLAEAPAGKGTDNLTVPAAGALAFLLLEGIAR